VATHGSCRHGSGARVVRVGGDKVVVVEEV